MRTLLFVAVIFVFSGNQVIAGELQGKVQAAQGYSGFLSPKIASFIMEIKVKPGDYVKKGDPCIIMDQVPQEVAQKKYELEEAEANLSLAEVALHNAGKDTKRAEALHPAKAISDSDYDFFICTRQKTEKMVNQCRAHLEWAKLSLGLKEYTNSDYYRVLSPIDGKVVSLTGKMGETFTSASLPTVWGEVLNLSVVDVVTEATDIQIKDLSLSLGRKVTIKSGDKEFIGEVVFISPVMNEKSQAMPVTIRVKNEKEMLRINEKVSVMRSPIAEK